MTKSLKRNPTPRNHKVAEERVFTSRNPKVAKVLDDAEGIEPLKGAELTQQMDELAARANAAWRQGDGRFCGDR